MRAVAPDADVAAGAEDLAADQVGRARDDAAREVAPRRARQDGLGHQADCRLDVRRVDAGGDDLDDHLVVTFADEHEFLDRRIDRLGCSRFDRQAHGPRDHLADTCLDAAPGSVAHGVSLRSFDGRRGEHRLAGLHDERVVQRIPLAADVGGRRLLRVLAVIAAPAGA